MTGKRYNGAALSDEITEQRLTRLLNWLDPDARVAAEKYEAIRKRLIKIFVCRGSNIPEELADNTIDRIARIIETNKTPYVGEPVHYFLGVAVNILHESIRKERVPAVLPPLPAPNEGEGQKYACFEKCMAKLSEVDRDLVIAYYRLERHAKIDHRRKLAEQLGTDMNALRIRLCRIRKGLRKCVMKEIENNRHHD
jgi:DNA-directed RNA polymerase specialized sigma24 family protein